MSNVAEQAKVAEKVKVILAQEFCVSELRGLYIDRLTEETRLKEDLDVDSLDRVNLVLECEKEFDIDISNEEWDKVRTVGDIIALVQRLV